MRNRSTFFTQRGALLAATALAALASTPAWADPAPAPVGPATAPDDASNGVEEVVVTARKTSEKLQNVPITITALTAAAIEKTDTKTLFDLATRTPGLYYGTSGGRNGGNKLQIRNFSTGTTGGSKASVFIDGVYVSGDYSSTPLANLERIEVLKGPQSAYFGRSTFVGAVNFVTRDPGAEFEGKLEGLYARFGETDFNGYVTTPIIGDTVTNTVSGRVFDFSGPSKWKGADGYHYGDQSTKAISDKLLIRPFDGLTLRWYNSFIYDRDHIPAVVFAPLNTRNSIVTRPDGTQARYFSGPVKLDYSAANMPNLFTSRINGFINDPGVTRRQYRSVLSFDSQVAGQQLSGYAAMGKETLRNNFDLSYVGAGTITAPNAFGVPTNYSYSQSSYYLIYQTRDEQYELRLRSPDDWRIRYLIGYNRTNIHGRTTFFSDPLLANGTKAGPAPVLAGLSNNTVLGNPSKTDGLFGGLYFDLTSKITVAAELRHQWEKIHPLVYATSATSRAVVSDFQNTFKSTLPRFNVQYQPNKNINIYAVYSVGNNPGIFNTGNVPVSALPAGVSVAVPEEKLYNYEAGIKTTWLDGRLTFNAAVYHMDWKNQQIQQSYVTNFVGTTPTPGAISSLFSGGAQSKVTGFEAELDARVTPELSLRATTSYGKAKYVKFCSSNYYAVTGVATALGCRSVAGFQQEGTPAFQASLFADYTRHISDTTDAYIRADYQYQSKVYLEEWDASWNPPANIMGLRVGVNKGDFGLELFARNLLNEENPQRITRAGYAFGVGGPYPAVVTPFGTLSAGSPGNQTVAPLIRRPRQVGVRATVKF